MTSPYIMIDTYNRQMVPYACKEHFKKLADFFDDRGYTLFRQTFDHLLPSLPPTSEFLQPHLTSVFLTDLRHQLHCFATSFRSRPELKAKCPQTIQAVQMQMDESSFLSTNAK